MSEALFTRYRVITGAGQKASLGFTDSSVLHINQRTDLALASPDVVRLKSGEVAARVRPGSNFQIVTGTAVSAAVGTLFDVRIQKVSGGPYATGPLARFPAGTTTTSVTEGVVRVHNRFGAVTVHPGEWTHVPPGKPPTRPTRHNARGDLRWSSGLP